VVIDGQVSTPLSTGTELSLRVYPKQLKMVVNPRMGYWTTLAQKMHWAAPPQPSE
jgi:NAD kinase